MSMMISPPEKEANARLIATAPELLAALEELIRDAENYISHANQAGCQFDEKAELWNARAAIAKVRGENAEVAV